jgi:hypothetical protein
LSPSSHDRQEWPGHGLRPWERARWPTPNGRRPPSSWIGWAHLPGRRAPFDDDRRSADQVWAAPAQVTVGELRLFRLLRVACTDARSTRRFARYWWLIRPASGAIRRSRLAAIKRRAERHAKRSQPPGRCWQRTPLRQQAAAIIAPGSCDQGGRCTTCKAAVEVEGLHRVGRLEPRRPTRRLKRVIHRLGSARCAVWG